TRYSNLLRGYHSPRHFAEAIAEIRARRTPIVVTLDPWVVADDPIRQLLNEDYVPARDLPPYRIYVRRAADPVRGEAGGAARARPATAPKRHGSPPREAPPASPGRWTAHPQLRRRDSHPGGTTSRFARGDDDSRVLPVRREGRAVENRGRGRGNGSGEKPRQTR